MKSYKIHSIKNNKKLSFIIDGESEEEIKRFLSIDGFIVLTIEEVFDVDNKKYFIFEALREDKDRIEGKIEAIDVFEAYKILKDDYEYIVTKIFPIGVTDKDEQDAIFRNILEAFPVQIKKEKVQVNQTTGEIMVLRSYFEILTKLVSESTLENKEVILFDIRRIQMTNGISSMEEMIKKITKKLYESSSSKTKKEIYKKILPIVKKENILILPPEIYIISDAVSETLYLLKVLFLGSKKKIPEQTKKKESILIHWLQKIHQNSSPEKKIFANKNIHIILKKKYRQSWLDIFREEGSYFYWYSLLRQVKILFGLKIIQEYVGLISLYASFFLVLGIICVGLIQTTAFFFFSGFVYPIIFLVSVSLVFFYKEV